MVNGIKYLRCHPTVIVQPYKSGGTVSADDKKVLGSYKKQLDNATKFIPTWVKVAVAIALGLGTMIGWKRIVVTVGERIGRGDSGKSTGAILSDECMPGSS